MGGVSAAIAGAARQAGAEIRAGENVARVAVNSQGRAVGVELDDGTVVRAKRVVSNAHPKTTYLDLVGRDHLSDEVVRDVERYRTRSGSVKINLALNELPEYPAWDQDGDVHRGLMAVSPSMAYLERAFDDAKYGRASQHPYAEVMFPTAHEPDLAPANKHIMMAFTQYGPYELAEGSWDTERDAYANRVIDELARFAPNLPGAVERLEVLTPKDLEDRFGLIGGNIMQGELTPDQMFSFRPIPFYGDHRTPIEGLYMCGGGTHPGGGVMAVPGRNCSGVVLKDLRLGRIGASLRTLFTRP
jgi:phytoene dehydrogenase-like protein